MLIIKNNKISMRNREREDWKRKHPIEQKVLYLQIHTHTVAPHTQAYYNTIKRNQTNHTTSSHLL
jgi:hypothetical protein